MKPVPTSCDVAPRHVANYRILAATRIGKSADAEAGTHMELAIREQETTSLSLSL